uniref:Beta-xylosidase/alpha-L-arabinofuranosidase 2-like n=1 Tax=Elaeis guineensis var. tenera TaxID=51953 RepID=A0A6I9QTE5_ELAGV|nr:beta-xylosidase/alpha-L-arabinofuranosidase 2-like [Elaeis guineensis]
MATFHLFFLLSCAAAIISPSFSRSLEPSFTSTPSRSLAAGPPSPKPGPIQTNGKNFSKVCDPARFKELSLVIDDFAYCDKSLPYEVRVKDLIGRMTLSEKVAQLGDKADGVQRIGLPKYYWWSEALHGIATTGFGTHFGDIVPGATSFPTPILTAASFNESLWKTVAQAISTEGRAMYNLGHSGLTFWSPNINVVRDPRWGRALETPGEDPFMIGVYAINFVRGLQDVEQTGAPQDLSSRPLKVSGCCKHFAAYDLDKWFFEDRHKFDARVTEQDMVETFMRPFEVCVKEGDVSSVMCSFNKINGIPACADTNLMTRTFRDEYKLNGYIVSDCDSLDVIYHVMNWLGDTQEDAIGQTLKAGLDLNCGWGQYNIYQHWGESAVAQGKVRETDIDRALTNLYMVLMRTGFFDNIPAYENLGLADICNKENIELATEAARQGIVLLKNNNALPLDPKKIKLAALIGPHANATTPMIGNYNGIPCRYTSPLDAIGKDVKVDYRQGCDVLCMNETSFALAMASAKNADVTIIFAGLSLDVEAEERDRMDLLLPGNQTDLIDQVSAASKGPVVLVILSGGAVDITFAENNPKIGAIIWAGYPGEEGGQAIADVIFGRHNPAGKLPLTWYKNDYIDALPMTSMQLRPVEDLGYPGRTYKFFNGPVLYPFGYGLSYTAFNYSAINTTTSSLTLEVNTTQFCKPLTYMTKFTAPPCPSLNTADYKCSEEINFEVEVKNTGNLDGYHTALVYSKPPPEVANAPMKQLVAFQRVFVPAKQSAKLNFTINACKALALVDKTAYTVLPAGKHTIVVGDGPESVSFPVEVNLQI